MATKNVNTNVNTGSTAEYRAPHDKSGKPGLSNPSDSSLYEVLDLSLKTTISSEQGHTTDSPKKQAYSDVLKKEENKLTLTQSPSSIKQVPVEKCEKEKIQDLHKKTAATPAGTSGSLELGYKSKHPIGSRKVTENIITYHEPMFQSVVNNLFESEKSKCSTGKRKADDRSKGIEDKNKNEIGSPDTKKRKLDEQKTNSPTAKVKKKDSIEKIVDKIRSGEVSGGKVSPTKSQTSILKTKEDKHLVLKPSDFPFGKGRKVSFYEDSMDCKNASSTPAKGFEQKETLSEKISDSQSCDKSTSSIDKEIKIRNEAKISSEHSDTGSVKKDKSKSMVKKLKPKSIDDSKNKMPKVMLKNKSSVQKMKNKEKQKSNQGFNKVSKKDAENSEAKKQSKDNSKKIRRNSDENATAAKKGKVEDNDDAPKKPRKGRPPKDKESKNKKHKPVFPVKRAKREASLNAAMLVNILYEKSPSKLSNTKRSKSESDILSKPQKSASLSQSCSELQVMDDTLTKSFQKSSDKKQKVSPKKENSKKNSFSDDEVFSSFDTKSETAFVRKTSPKKERDSPKHSASTSSDSSNAMTGVKKKNNQSKGDGISQNKKEKIAKDKTNTKSKNRKINETLKTKKKSEPSKKKTDGNVSKSPEEIAERKRKANLARIKKAKELLRTKKLFIQKGLKEEEDSGNSDYEEMSDDETDVFEKDQSDSFEADVKKVKRKRGALLRAARTHVSVELKNTLYENVSSSPKWCECCQSTYYPSQSQQGTKIWRVKELVDKGSSSPAKQIQSSSQHLIAANRICDVRPYASPSHVPVIESSAYVGQLMTHGHMGCSACGCGHSGMLHTPQCQNYAIGGVGNLLPCQRYSSPYSVPYAHSSYSHCGCTACCTSSSYHHATGQPLLHQPQMPITTDPLLVHHPVQLQMSHESTHSVSIPGPLQITHSDSNLALPLQMNHGESGLPQHLPLACKVSQGEITNVTMVRSNSQSDQEFIDVGKEDVVQSVTSLSTTGGSVKLKQYKKALNSKKYQSEKVKFVKMKKFLANDNKKANKLKPSKFDVTLKTLKEKSLALSSKKQIEKILKISKKKSVEQKKVNKDKVKTDAEIVKVKKSKAEKVAKEDKVKKSLMNKKKSLGLMPEVGRPDSDMNSSMELDLKDERKAVHGWSWSGEGVIKKITNIFDGQPVQRKCFNAIQHEDGEEIHVKDCILVCSGRKKRDIPYVAKVASFFEDPDTEEMMMTIVWYYRPEHTECGRKSEHLENEVFAAKHRDEVLVACIEDKGYVLTYNEYCRYFAEVQRTKYCLPIRKKVVPDPEEIYPRHRIPPLDVDPENVFLCRQVYDIKLKRVLKNPS